MNYLNSKKAAVFCFVTGICLLAIGAYLNQSSTATKITLNTQQAWYFITGTALSLSGVVQFLRDETI